MFRHLCRVIPALYPPVHALFKPYSNGLLPMDRAMEGGAKAISANPLGPVPEREKESPKTIKNTEKFLISKYLLDKTSGLPYTL